MQRLEVSGAVRPLYGSLGVKGLKYLGACNLSPIAFHAVRKALSFSVNRKWSTTIIDSNRNFV